MKRIDIMVPDAIKSEYPNAVAHVTQSGELLFTAEMTIGGVDDEGIYLFCLDGPAEGEKAYL